MLRFVAFVWDSANPEHTAGLQVLKHRLAQIPGLREAFSAPGLHMSCSGAGTHAIQTLGRAGVLAGEVFRRQETPSPSYEPAVLNSVEIRDLLSSGGRRLIDTYWGNYVAFLIEPTGDTKWVVRAPIGHLPCLRAERRGVQVYFSFLPDLMSLGLFRPTVNWNFVAAQMVTPPADSAETGLRNISALRYGECIEASNDRLVSHRYWDPESVIRNGPVLEAPEAAIAMRAVTRACTHALVSRHSTVIHKLSGGLDSSIILSCLADAPSRPTIICVNDYSDGAAEDERQYARLAATRAGCQLIEVPRNSKLRLSEILNPPISEVPRFYPGDFESMDANRKIIADYRPTAVFTGTGGDQVFFNISPLLSVVDYVHDHAINARTLRVAWQAARLENLGIGKVLLTALTRGLVPHRWNAAVGALSSRSLLTQKTVDLALAVHASADRSTRYIPEGKQYQLAAVTLGYGYYRALRPLDPPMQVTPLICQPLVELCLRVPTYVLVSGGRDRATARRAFANDLPPEIVQRRSKGRISRYTRELMKVNLDFLRDVLSGGVLAREGWVDGEKLRQLLSGDPANVIKGTAEVLGILCTEVWLGALLEADRRAAA